MEPDQTEINQVKNTVEKYIEGSRKGNLALLKEIFHENATMSGYMLGELQIGTPEPFFEAVANNPAPEQSGEDYKAEIKSVMVSGQIASAELEESGFLGLSFTDYFQLIKTEGNWLILNKMFTTHQP